MKKGMILILLVFLSVLISGCTSFDASAYTKAILDVSYKNETEEYIKMTGSSAEDATAIFKRNINATVKGFNGEKIPKELEQKYNTLFENIITKVHYSVAEAVETEKGNYAVEVTVWPITLFDDIFEEFQTKGQEYAVSIANEVMNGAEMPADEDMQKEIAYDLEEIIRSVRESEE